MRVGFLGLGRMGLPMATHLVRVGHEVIAYDTDDDARSRATGAGVAVVESLGEFADREIVCSSLPDTPNVEEAYSAEGGVFEVVEAGTICVDLSTISVTTSRAIAAEASDRGIEFLDAPVSGAPMHSQEGILVVMVGGSADVLKRARPAIEPFAAKIDHIGPNGAGLQLKLVTNRLIGTYLTVIGEAIVGMEAVGLDVESGMEVIRAGVVPKLLDFRARPMMERDYAPQFTVDLMAKDLRLAAEALPRARLAVLAREIIDQVSSDGHGAEDPAAIMRILEQEVPE
jgi:2-hydroxy-3-oxopropionate reductase